MEISGYASCSVFGQMTNQLATNTNLKSMHALLVQKSHYHYQILYQLATNAV